ncbi:hypothetical protein B0F90DRAFT_1688488 [Multifurca ochricompacta]|uniref:RNA polymerase II-associated protein 3 n=1 Tax=Multifurca ochricompacta TaxID=376703 RepID=A0AAD4M9H0_9AGAM|nr:hypothetical protein B0F90DRAFT_1688488 [Multifurca ochricompacta]
MDSAKASKEKGNTAFKDGDYVAAIGHYTAAALADPSDPTFFLNRAAAYLKLSKNEDAERDCTTVINLSNDKNAKAFFRRAQARVALQKLPDAHNDLQRALRIEPRNESVKAELARVDELILNWKGKAKQRSAPIEITTPSLASSSSSSTTALSKRRRVPITIVDDDDNDTSVPSTSRPSSKSPNDFLNPITAAAAATTTTTQKPKPASFKEAKQARDEKTLGRVGGGIFRMSGKDTSSRHASSPKDPTTTPSPQPAQAPPPPPSYVHPRTLLEFTRTWNNIPASDTGARWTFLNIIPLNSFPALFGSSLDPTLLASFIPVLAAAASGSLSPNADVVAVREFMCTLPRVLRFRTIVQFLSKAEKIAAREVWEKVIVITRRGADGSQDADADEKLELEQAARAWGFTDV